MKTFCRTALLGPMLLCATAALAQPPTDAKIVASHGRRAVTVFRETQQEYGAAASRAVESSTQH
jgi:hypothetical protein